MKELKVSQEQSNVIEIMNLPLKIKYLNMVFHPKLKRNNFSLLVHHFALVS